MRCLKTKSNRGFTLVEVMVALAIIGLVAVLLLAKRVDVVKDAGKTRDERLAWVLAAWKMGEIERDPAVFQGGGISGSGDFNDLAPEYAEYYWETEPVREKVATNDPEIPDELPKEIWRVKLRVRRGNEPPILEIESMFPVVPEP